MVSVKKSSSRFIAAQSALKVKENRGISDIPASIYDIKTDILTISPKFNDLSVPCNLFWKAEIRQFCALGTEGLRGENARIWTYYTVEDP